MSLCAEVLTQVDDAARDDWHCTPLDDNRMLVVLPRRFADGDAVELIMQVIDGSEVELSDGGEILARLDRAGVNIGAGRARKLWRQFVRAFGLTITDGRILLSGQRSEAGWLVQSMADAVVNLSGIELLAPAPRSELFAERLTAFFQAEFPFTVEQPELFGRSKTRYRATAETGTEAQPVYVQALAGGTAQTRNRAVEHTFTMFADVDGTLSPDQKLAVLDGELDKWPEERVTLLAQVCYIGIWRERHLLTEFIARRESAGNRLLLPVEQPLR
jgi:hypothetical protein